MEHYTRSADVLADVCLVRFAQAKARGVSEAVLDQQHSPVGLSSVVCFCTLPDGSLVALEKDAKIAAFGAGMHLPVSFCIFRDLLNMFI